MATIKQGILGGFSGRVANLVGSSWKGINVMRAVPTSVNNPRTASQISNRTNFKAFAQLGSECLTDICKPLWDRFAKEMSGYNRFVQVNKKIHDDASGAWDFSQLITSSGKLGETAISSVSFSGNNLQVSWNTQAVGDYQQASDIAYIMVVINGNTSDGIAWSRLAFNTGTVARSTGSATVALGTVGEEMQVDVYLAFRRTDGTMVGNSSHKMQQK